MNTLPIGLKSRAATARAARDDISRAIELVQRTRGEATATSRINTEQFLPIKDTTNVLVRVCSLDALSVESCTIVNCVFNKGGCIDLHSHANHETVFVLNGTLHDTVSGAVYSPGDVVRVEPDVVHGFESDYALLTIIWRPAFNTVASMDDNTHSANVDTSHATLSH